MLQVTNIDVSGVSRLIGGLHNALIGTGGRGDIGDVISDETRKLSLECGSAPNARRRKKIEASMRRDIGKVFMKAPAHPFTGTKRKGDGIEWLNAGPNFLLGVPEDRMLGDAELSMGGAKKLFYIAKGRLPAERYADGGMHGQQHVQIANRFVVKRGIISKLFNEIKKRIGLRDASFTETAKNLGGNVPSTSSKHFPTGKNITQVKNMSSASPEIIFGSRATGVVGLTEKVKRAVAIREKKMLHRLGLILSGYARDNNSGGSIKKHSKS